MLQRDALTHPLEYPVLVRALSLLHQQHAFQVLQRRLCKLQVSSVLRQMEVLISKRMDHGLFQIGRLPDIPMALKGTSTVATLNGHTKDLPRREYLALSLTSSAAHLDSLLVTDTSMAT